MVISTVNLADVHLFSGKLMKFEDRMWIKIERLKNV